VAVPGVTVPRMIMTRVRVLVPLVVGRIVTMTVIVVMFVGYRVVVVLMVVVVVVHAV
jgi:hypothetical protein